MSLHFLNDVVNDAKSIQNRKLRHDRYLKNETMGKLINRILGLHLLISSLPGSWNNSIGNKLLEIKPTIGEYQSVVRNIRKEEVV